MTRIIRLKPGVPRWTAYAVPLMFGTMLAMLGWMLVISLSGRDFTGTEKGIVVVITLAFFVAYWITYSVVERATRPYLPEE